MKIEKREFKLGKGDSAVNATYETDCDGNILNVKDRRSVKEGLHDGSVTETEESSALLKKVTESNERALKKRREEKKPVKAKKEVKPRKDNSED